MNQVSTRRTPDGRAVLQTNSYVELATGLHYWEDNQWKETREEIEIFEGAAVARQGPHKVIWAANLNSPGAIDLSAPDGQRLRSHILGLAYTDLATGVSVMIAEVKDCNGAVLPPHQVYYLDAFEGECRADVRYTYTKAGFEQDVILLSAPPSPAAWGLGPGTTRLEVFTEFIEAPQPTVVDIVLKRQTDPLLREVLTEPDLIDQRLDFGGIGIGPGQAFPLGHADPFDGPGVPCGKSWEGAEGRVFLIEKVDYVDILPQLSALPQMASAREKADQTPAKAGKPGKLLARRFPPTPSGERGRWQANQLARAELDKRTGVVIDYVSLNGSVTNYIFQGDTTYYISSALQLYGTNIIEGGTVIKFAQAGQNTLDFYGQIDCRTAPWHPAILTAKDDHSVGETLSTNSPSGYYAYYGVLLRNSTVPYDLHDLRIRHSTYGVATLGSAQAVVSHFQVRDCQKGAAWQGGAVRFRNFLFSDLGYAFYGWSIQTNGFEHGTFHRIATFRGFTNYNFYLTNCLLISVTNKVVYEGTNVVTCLDDTGIFSTIGSGEHYLAEGSPYRDAGTMEIDETLLGDLRRRTTYGPIVLTNLITTDTVLAPQVPRDTGLPDLGYLYDPLDFVVRGVVVSNATLRMTNGVVLGTGGAAGEYGLLLEDNARLVAQGTPAEPCRVVCYTLVQEGTESAWSSESAGYSLLTVAWPVSNHPTAQFRFVDWGLPGGDGYHVWAGFEDIPALEFRDCQFRGGVVCSDYPGMMFTNCLFERVDVQLGGVEGNFRNNTIIGGRISVDSWFGAYRFLDNFFDTTNLVQNGAVSNSHNGYLSAAHRWTPTNTAGDVVLTNRPIYAVGPLGRHYYPTNDGLLSTLIDAGSITNAGQAGLFYHTTTTNQVPEGAGRVDVGFHYVALADGQPIDTDGEGVPDYLEDADGSGFTGAGESDREDPDSDNDGVDDYVERILGRNPLAGVAPETNGVVGLEVFTPLK